MRSQVIFVSASTQVYWFESRAFELHICMRGAVTADENIVYARLGSTDKAFFALY